ncbi:hypothetical protein KC640_03140 [Candidatus Dojkabacteria bacterium]|uniref:Uncharacterized protein n=1 Tax=Candidatus Dojkabacteria bacterium TaxID=2099670 RepID=A0A955L0P0_9BACT|nr:hypothetical protein [Candidatus Dojkabacteria bacterium]
MVKMYGEDNFATAQKQQVSVVQILMVTVIVMTTFVIPAQLIDYQRQQATTTNAYNLSVVAEKVKQEEAVTSSEETTTGTPQVAGVSTTAASKHILQIPGTQIRINLDSEVGMLVILGTMLIAVALGLSVYLLATSEAPAKATLPASRSVLE